MDHSFPSSELEPPPLYKAQAALSTPLILSRDFAYEDNGPTIVPSSRMAGGDVTSASAKTFAHLLSGGMIEIFVGPEKRHWSIHRNLLCHHSSYFGLHFPQHELPKKNDRSHLDLFDHHPAGFELLVKWLYQGTLAPASEQSTSQAKYDYAVACHKLWLLCEKFDMVRLKNLAMDVYRRCLNESQLVPDADEIDEIYRRSPVGSPFNSLMISIAARQIMDPEVERDLGAYRKCFEANPEFAVELVSTIRRMSGGILFDDPTRGDSCAWHDHDDVSGCPLQGKGKARVNKPDEQDTGKEQPQPLVVESSAEKRTPRKLRTSQGSSLTVADRHKQPTPKTLPSRLNAPGSRMEPPFAHSEVSEATGNHTQYATDLIIKTLDDLIIMPHPDELSPRHMGSSDQQLLTAVSKFDRQLGQLGTCSAAVTHQTVQRTQVPISSGQYDAHANRKRKRTPRKLQEKLPVTVSVSGLSSRADSVMSGHRVSRVNSLVRKLESKENTNTNGPSSVYGSQR